MCRVVPGDAHAEPFLGIGAGVKGPATVTFRMGKLRNVEGKIEWLTPGGDKKRESSQSAPYTITGGDWQEVTVRIPAEGPIGILRLYLPVQQGPTELNWVEIQGAGAKERWEF